MHDEDGIEDCMLTLHVQSIATSDYHPQIAVASADGSVSTTNTFRSTRRSGRVPFLVHRVFRMEYSVKGGIEDETQDDETDEQQVPGKNKGKQKQTETETEKDSSKEPKQKMKPGVWRMTERYLPLETQERPNNSTAKGAAGNGNAPSEPSVGVWPTEQAATRTCWHSGAGVAGASWLASGTMSGLGRVNWLEGRWLGDRMPYGETEVLRQENETPAVSMRTDGVQEDELDSEEDRDA
jgi:transcription factor C subunit 6